MAKRPVGSFVNQKRIFAIFAASIVALGIFWSVSIARSNETPLKACGLTPGPIDRVVDVIDGDTVLLASGNEVRFVGLQAPKLPLGRKGFSKWPLADEAKAYVEKVLQGQSVQLFYGDARIDRHGRILAHLWQVDEQEPSSSERVWIQKDLLERGLARVYSFSDNRVCVGALYSAEASARDRGLGIWALDYYTIRKAIETPQFIDTFQVVEGRVLHAEQVRSGVYLNFGEVWREDFTIFVAKKNLRVFDKAGFDLIDLEGQTIRVRGWLQEKNGPMILATHPEQFELIDRRAASQLGSEAS